MIRINRNAQYSDKTRSYKVIVDERHVGDLKSNERFELELPKGNYTIYLKIDWCRSNQIDLHVADNEVVTFNCGNSMTGWRKFFSLLYVTVFKNRYLWLAKI